MKREEKISWGFVIVMLLVLLGLTLMLSGCGSGKVTKESEKTEHKEQTEKTSEEKTTYETKEEEDSTFEGVVVKEESRIVFEIVPIDSTKSVIINTPEGEWTFTNASISGSKENKKENTTSKETKRREASSNTTAAKRVSEKVKKEDSHESSTKTRTYNRWIIGGSLMFIILILILIWINRKRIPFLKTLFV